MRISFDLDETLILSNPVYPCEPLLGFPLPFVYTERLRKGTIDLMKQLRANGHEVCIYTTSERPVPHIRKLFRRYGIHLTRVVNESVHMEKVQDGRSEIMPSKYPPKFGIDLHFDDDSTVQQNGKQYGFRVFVVDPVDEEWVPKVFAEVERVERILGSR